MFIKISLFLSLLTLFTFVEKSISFEDWTEDNVTEVGYGLERANNQGSPRNTLPNIACSALFINDCELVLEPCKKRNRKNKGVCFKNKIAEMLNKSCKCCFEGDELKKKCTESMWECIESSKNDIDVMRCTYPLDYNPYFNCPFTLKMPRDLITK